MQIMAANGYIVVAPNRRGLPGFGLEWNEAISGDYGGQCMKDYFTAIDEMAKEPFVDSDRLGCVGASFGGFSVYLVGRTSRQALQGIHCPRRYIQHGNAVPGDRGKMVCQLGYGRRILGKGQRYSPTYVCQLPPPLRRQVGHPYPLHSWRKGFPHPCQPGNGCIRCCVMRGVPAELLIYPDENHWY